MFIDDNYVIQGIKPVHMKNRKMILEEIVTDNTSDNIMKWYICEKAILISHRKVVFWVNACARLISSVYDRQF